MHKENKTKLIRPDSNYKYSKLSYSIIEVRDLKWNKEINISKDKKNCSCSKEGKSNSPTVVYINIIKIGKY